MGSVTPLLRALQTLRVRVRTDEIWLAIFGALVGALAGLCAVAMNQITQFAHRKLFLLHAGQRLSGAFAVNHERLLLVPMLGGLLIGILAWGLARHWPRRPVDPIEANALHGGRMSMRDSLIVAIQTMISNGAGASVGLEAAYAQVGGAVGSKLALAFNLRRNDMRILVGAGTAGAIAAAFNAPLTGAFYAFELVIGTYSLTNLAPVLLAAAASVGIIHLFEGGTMSTQIVITGSILPIDYVPILALGLICALLGIALMRAVTLTEDIVRLTHLPVWLRTAIGGLIVGGLGLISPQVLSAGHGAMEFGLTHKTAMVGIALLFGLKSLASAVSLGTGFRGGLFFASLLLGSLVGRFYSGTLLMFAHGPALPPEICAVVGMASFAVAVVGGPLTMVFLALESTGSLPLTVAVLAAVVLSSLTVRRTFGYSFATWRFHLRGEAIRSPADVGWVRNLTVGRMMRPNVLTCPIGTSLENFKRDVPLGATQRMVMIDAAGGYQGIVMVPEAHALKSGDLANLIRYADFMLLPSMNVKDALGLFATAQCDALAVVENNVTRKVIGLLTEAYALRRYSDELERRRREVTGE
jgi:CIC family chloride channel protein